MAERIFGVIGDPVGHSLSPALHNAAFAALKIDAEYRRFPVSSAELPTFLTRLHSGEINGVNVTVPHKRAVIPLLDEISDEARVIGAVNTIVNDRGKLVGHNTDGMGYLESLNSEFAPNMGETYAVLIGAGGAAMAVAHALVGAGIASLEIVNRDRARAENLAARLQITHPAAHVPTAAFSDLARVCEDANLLVNATSLGLEGNDWPDLGFVKALADETIVSDIVYVPRQTPLLKAALARGLKVHYGAGMLIYQAVRAFEIFTGEKAPAAEMRDALENALA
jgi:shikimate dehydrogenase